jgi:hypothetical protein
MASEWPLGLPLAVRYGSGRYAAIVAADAALTPKQREDVAANWERLRKGAVHVRCAENPTLFRAARAALPRPCVPASHPHLHAQRAWPCCARAPAASR